MTSKLKEAGAMLTTSLLIGALVGGIFLSPLVAVFASAIALVLIAFAGYPVFLLLRRFRVANVWTSVAAGFLIAALLMGWLMWPLRYEGMGGTSSHGVGVDLVYTQINGYTTAAGWREFFWACSIFGALGGLGGGVFWELAQKKRTQKLDG